MLTGSDKESKVLRIVALKDVALDERATRGGSGSGSGPGPDGLRGCPPSPVAGIVSTRLVRYRLSASKTRFSTACVVSREYVLTDPKVPHKSGHIV